MKGSWAVIAIGTVMMAGTILQGGPTVTFGEGIGQFAAIIGIDPKVGKSLGLLALNSFLLTSLDTATRLARYQLQEFVGMKADKSGMRLDKFTATIISVAAAAVLVFFKTGDTPAWKLIWPVFGASNQLVAALALLAVGVWVSKGLKKNASFIMIPMVFMFVTTIAALGLLLKDKIAEGNYLLSGISGVLLVLRCSSPGKPGGSQGSCGRRVVGRKDTLFQA